ELDLRLKGLNTLLDSEYADISLEVVAGWQRELEAAHTRAEDLSERRDDLALALTRLRELATAWTQHGRASAELAKLDARAEEVMEGARRAASARRVAGVLPLLAASQRAAGAFSRANAELERLAGEAAADERALQAAGLRQGAAEDGAAQIPALEAHAERLREAEGLVRRLRLAGGRPELTHPQPLPWDEEEHARANEGAEKSRALNLERVQLEAAQAALERRRGDQRLGRAQQEGETRELERLKAEGVRGKGRLEELRAHLAQAEALAGVQRHRPLLSLDDPCPLCEQTVRELPADRADRLTAEVERLGLDVQRLDASLTLLRDRWTTLHTDTRVRAQRLEEDERRLEEEGLHLQA
ncbi:MAG: SMC family ATPase, partial [Deinococcus sp.]